MTEYQYYVLFCLYYQTFQNTIPLTPADVSSAACRRRRRGGTRLGVPRAGPPRCPAHRRRSSRLGDAGRHTSPSARWGRSPPGARGPCARAPLLQSRCRRRTRCRSLCPLHSSTWSYPRTRLNNWARPAAASCCSCGTAPPRSWRPSWWSFFFESFFFEACAGAARRTGCLGSGGARIYLYAGSEPQSRMAKTARENGGRGSLEQS